MGRLTYLLHKIKTFFRYISTPAWRWATLFLLWGAGHYGLYNFILKTSLTALNTPKDFFLRLSVWCGIWLLAIILCFLSHLPGVYFAPWRSVRLCLWIFSVVTVLCRLYFGEYYFVLATLIAQFTADAIHTILEYRQAEPSLRPKLRKSLAVGCLFALLPLTSWLNSLIRCYYLQLKCEKRTATLQLSEKITPVIKYGGKAKSDFEQICDAVLAAWKHDDQQAAAARWCTLNTITQSEPTGAWFFEMKRLEILSNCLNAKPITSPKIYQDIQAELLASEKVWQDFLYKEEHYWNHYHREIFLSGSYNDMDDYQYYQPFITKHLFPHNSPSSDLPPGLERLYRYTLINIIDTFYSMKAESLSCSLADMPKLEDRFETWLLSIPWSYDRFAPNAKCICGLGVHCHRYHDIYAHRECVAKYREAQCAVALHYYKQNKGQYPDELSQLVPDYLEHIPLDPFTDSPVKLAGHPKKEDMLSVYTEGKYGCDYSPDHKISQGFLLKK